MVIEHDRCETNPSPPPRSSILFSSRKHHVGKFELLERRVPSLLYFVVFKNECCENVFLRGMEF